MDDYQRAEQIVRGLQEARAKKRRVDWDDPEAVADYRAEVRLQRRLRNIPEDRKCPGCGQFIEELSRWVLKRGEVPLCRSCFHMAPVRAQAMGQAVSEDDDSDLVDLPVLPFVEPLTRYVVDGAALKLLREACGLSRSEFARHCGWSRSRQSRLEAGMVSTVMQEVVERVQVVAISFGVDTSRWNSSKSLKTTGLTTIRRSRED